ncbi:MAG: SEC-C domain-containing protein [Burkholderiales bacterium]|nr:SEC-C domain-containing protein [Burkholderiales bacterium]
MLSFVVNSIDPAKFAAVSASIARSVRGATHEVVGIHDARSMCDGYARGLARSAGDPVVFCHDDLEILCTDLPARLDRHLARFDVFGPVGTRKLVSMNWADAGAEYLYGAMSGPDPGGRLATGYFGGATREVDGIVALEGVFIVASRAAALAVGWDDATFDDWHGYDTDFSFRAHLAGWRVGVVLDLPIVHQSAGRRGAGYERSRERFAAKHAGRLASDRSGVNLITYVPMADHDAIRAFFDGGDLAAWHRESRLRIDRARTSPGVRRPATLMGGGWDPSRASAGRIDRRADPPTRNGACPCGSGRRYKECHGAAAGGRGPG